MSKKRLNSPAQALVTSNITALNKKQRLPGDSEVKEFLNLEEEKNFKGDLTIQLVELSQGYNDLVNSSIVKNLSVANLRINLSKDIFNHFLVSMANMMQQNITFTKELVKCKDVNDLATLHQKMIETYTQVAFKNWI